MRSIPTLLALALLAAPAMGGNYGGPGGGPGGGNTTVTIDFDGGEAGIASGSTTFDYEGSSWSGGVVDSQGPTALYATGSYAYHAGAGAQVLFEPPTDRVRFFFVHSATPGEARVFGPSGMIASLPSHAATFFSDANNYVEYEPASGGITRVELDPGTVVDAFSFRPGAAGGNAGTVRLGAGAYEVVEGGSAVVQLLREGGDDGTVSVAVRTASGDGEGGAIAGADFMAMDQVVTWADHDDDPRQLMVKTLQDDRFESTEHFTISLSDPTGGAVLGSPALAAVTIDDDDADTGPCVADAVTACLVGERFRVRILFQRDAASGFGAARALQYTANSTLFWFFSDDNIEVLLKMLDACGEPGFTTFWVFFAATTDRGMRIEVTDTQSGVQKVYENTLGVPVATVTDTSAFSTCP